MGGYRQGDYSVFADGLFYRVISVEPEMPVCREMPICPRITGVSKSPAVTVKRDRPERERGREGRREEGVRPKRGRESPENGKF